MEKTMRRFAEETTGLLGRTGDKRTRRLRVAKADPRERTGGSERLHATDPLGLGEGDVRRADAPHPPRHPDAAAGRHAAAAQASPVATATPRTPAPSAALRAEAQPGPTPNARAHRPDSPATLHRVHPPAPSTAPLPAPRMTFPRALRAALRRLARSPLAAAHLICGLTAGTACGAYFATARWDPLLGADAYAQFLGATMPLMAGIVCALAVDEERRAGRLSPLTGAPSRGRAVLGLYTALALMGAATLAVAFGLFAGILAAAGRLAQDPGTIALAWAGCTLGSLPLYALALGLALRWGRNVTIGAGAAGLILAFFSVGGLAHGLMTGALTGLSPAGALGAVPVAWPARLGSLGIEQAIARTAGDAATLGRIGTAGGGLALAALILTVLGLAALTLWFNRFEEGADHA